MKICLTVTSNYVDLYGHDFGRILDVARMADDASLYQIDFAEHLLMGDGKSYPFGEYPASLREPWPEPIVSLSAIAAVTQRVRLATGILIAPLRPAALLAKQLATLDRIAGGRLDIGVGSGWQREEFEACGIPFESREQRFDDTLRACRQLWCGEYIDLDAGEFQAQQVISVPPPQQPRLPVWFAGGPNSRTARRIAEMGDGWIPLFLGDDDLKRGIDLIRDAMNEAGRDPAALQVRQQLVPPKRADGSTDLEKMFSDAPKYEAMGVTTFGVGLGWCEPKADRVPALIERLGEFAR